MKGCRQIVCFGLHILQVHRALALVCALDIFPVQPRENLFFIRHQAQRIGGGLGHWGVSLKTRCIASKAAR